MKTFLLVITSLLVLALCAWLILTASFVLRVRCTQYDYPNRQGFVCALTYRAAQNQEPLEQNNSWLTMYE